MKINYPLFNDINEQIYMTSLTVNSFYYFSKEKKTFTWIKRASSDPCQLRPGN